jgi:hypothetical protein
LAPVMPCAAEPKPCAPLPPPLAAVTEGALAFEKSGYMRSLVHAPGSGLGSGRHATSRTRGPMLARSAAVEGRGRRSSTHIPIISSMAGIGRSVAMRLAARVSWYIAGRAASARLAALRNNVWRAKQAKERRATGRRVTPTREAVTRYETPGGVFVENNLV